MKRQIWLLVPLLVLGLVLVVYAAEGNQLYGNDEESIIEVINSIEGYENMSIQILEIKDFKDIRVVAFLAEGSPGYIEFDRNEDGNYKWRHLEVREEESFSTFLLSFVDGKTAFLLVKNWESEIAHMKVDVNGELLEVEFQPLGASATWVELSDKRNTFRNYRYYDKDGNLITM
jgi:hypothetical protein